MVHTVRIVAGGHHEDTSCGPGGLHGETSCGPHGDTEASKMLFFLSLPRGPTRIVGGPQQEVARQRGRQVVQLSSCKAVARRLEEQVSQNLRKFRGWRATSE